MNAAGTPSDAHDSDGLRPPIKLDAATDGEFVAIPLAPVHRHAKALAQAKLLSIHRILTLGPAFRRRVGRRPTPRTGAPAIGEHRQNK